MRVHAHRIVMTFLLATLAACGGSGGGYGGDDSPPPPPPPAAPTITLAALPSGSLNRSTTLTASVTAAAGVTRVEFLVDGSTIATVTTSPYTTTWDTTGVSDGNHTLTARVTDAAGATATTQGVTIAVNNHPVIAVALSPSETFPRPVSTASGSGELTFDLVNRTVTGGVTVTGITATLAHIHDAFAGDSGPVIVNFVQSGANPNRWDAQAGAVLTEEQISGLFAGRLYVNVHSAAYPAGEIRGQIQPENITLVLTDLTGGAVVPAVTTQASATAATTVDARASTATVHIVASGVDDATDAHVHKAAAGANNAAALLTLAKDGAAPGHWFIELAPVTAADRTDFDGNGWYADIHTPANAGGELRGQITPNPAPPPPPATTLTELQSTIFTPRCSGCHTGGGGSLPSSMNLSSTGATFAALVGVASVQQPSLQRVQPNSVGNSYIIRKLEGTAGISGSRMPLGGPFLDQDTIDEVKSWIDAGAQNN